MANFKGIVFEEEGFLKLNAGGVIVNLSGNTASLVALKGKLVVITGEQNGDTIKVPSKAESAAAVGEDGLQKIIEAIRDNTSMLMLPGVLGARPGYSRKWGSDEDELEIVLVSDGSAVKNFPLFVNGIPVEVQPATVREMMDGFSGLEDWLTGPTIAEAAEAAPNIQYIPPNHVQLKKAKVSNVTCHVGPDSGWSTLQPFLEGTEKTLTVAMYQFYAQHIYDTVTKLGRSGGGKSLQLILQNDKVNKDTQQLLKAAFGNRLKFVNASTSGPNRIFNNSYHTKVAVRDSESFWLSSGNWSPRSQPEVDPDVFQNMYQKGNREWHVVIEDKEMAQMYEEFIKYDWEKAFEVASVEMAPIMPDLLIPIGPVLEAAQTQTKLFEAKKFAMQQSIEATPLMSPDNYAKGVLKLIEEATEKLYLQFAYINKPDSTTFGKIITTIAEKMADDNIDVKVIVGSNQKPTNSDLLIGKYKWKRRKFKQQTSKLHNKGILVDDRYTVVGSNNWSSDGTQYNRDTSIIFDSPEINEYYTEVFDFDWSLTKPVTRVSESQPILAPESGEVPHGYARISWNDWFDE